MNGRIGSNGKYVHDLKIFLPESKYGVSVCEKWAGMAKPTEEPVNCPRCIEVKRRRTQ